VKSACVGVLSIIEPHKFICNSVGRIPTRATE
jgi:hypothetical protein